MKKKPEQLAARIKIVHTNGNEIAYLYSRESFELLRIPKNRDGYQFLEIGNTFVFRDKKYVIKNINFLMQPDFWEATDESYGINIYSLDSNPSGFDQNCQIGVFVEEV
ncbi:hypothetical protein [Bacteroides cellulosilyticus]|uniref:hypothetical protein n=1 Tax=Bacteroides cellulosilyticus TaxID=246787 RepID=UPI0018AB4856|nr:hypothetical protein [Bacteroides cellulosilyticus]